MTFLFATNAKVFFVLLCVYVSVSIECYNVDFIITLILISCADTWALKKFNRIKSFRQKLPFHIWTILIWQINHSHPKHAVENCSVTHSKRNEKKHTHTHEISQVASLRYQCNKSSLTYVGFSVPLFSKFLPSSKVLVRCVHEFARFPFNNFIVWSAPSDWTITCIHTSNQE